MEKFQPKQFGKYLLIRKLAVGGMAEIYKAKTYGVDGFEKQLAIKRILPHCAADKEFITMLIDEAKLSVLLSHANIVQVYDLGKVGNDYYISMEFIHGVNLRDTIYKCRERKQAIPPDIAIYIASEICKGLDYAHRKTDQNNRPLNIVHRDISPQNILISYEGEVKIVDFGIAKAAMNISHTMAGILKGKIAYMSPEQAMGKKVDRRTDIFSTGILLYEMLTGKRLFHGETQFEILKKIRTTVIKPDTLPPSIPPQLRIILAKALAHNPDDRYQHAGDFQIELTKLLYSTYIDFSPRKLAAFIQNLFAKEIENERANAAAEAQIMSMTTSVNVREGAKQMDIVHRKQTVITDIRKGDFKDKTTTTKTPVHEKKPQEERTLKRPKPSYKKKHAKKRRSVLKTTAILITLAAVGVLATQPPTLKHLTDTLFKSIHVKNKKNAKTAPPQTKKTASAKKAEGAVKITTTPDGAKIYINGKSTGKTTPATIRQLVAGSIITIRVEKDGYEPMTQKLKIPDDNEPAVINLKLEPADKGILNIITDPPGAAVMINGILTKQVTPTAIKNLPVGKDLKITLSKPGYEDFEENIRLATSRPQKISATLKPLKQNNASLKVKSSPSGASVYIDGKNTGKKTPAVLKDIKPGNHVIKLTLEGYNTWSTQWMANPDEHRELNISLTNKQKEKKKATETVEKKTAKTSAPEKTATKTSTLYINSIPSGASIYISGKYTGKKTPANITNLKTGRKYSIMLKKAGYQKTYASKYLHKANEKITLKLKKETKITKPAAPNTTHYIGTEMPNEAPAPRASFGPSAGFGKISVSSTPSGADVFVNSDYKGKTPITVTVPAGTAHVIVSKEGYARYSRNVTVKPGGRTNLGRVKLGSQYGKLNVFTNPRGATVVFDGHVMPATTPIIIKKVTTDQSHSISIQKPGYITWNGVVNMNGLSQRTININLQPR